MEIHHSQWNPTVTFASDASGHGDVGQCGSRHGFNSLGAVIGHCRQRVSSNCGGVCHLGLEWRHQQVLVLFDNMAVVQVISAQSSRDRTLMHLLRCIHFFVQPMTLNSGQSISQGDTMC